MFHEDGDSVMPRSTCIHLPNCTVS